MDEVYEGGWLPEVGNEPPPPKKNYWWLYLALGVGLGLMFKKKK